MTVHKLESEQALEPASEYFPSYSCSSEDVRPFKSYVVGVEYTPEGIVYILVHVTDGFKTTTFIKDFVVIQCGCYAKMRLVMTQLYTRLGSKSVMVSVSAHFSKVTLVILFARLVVIKIGDGGKLSTPHTSIHTCTHEHIRTQHSCRNTPTPTHRHQHGALLVLPPPPHLYTLFFRSGRGGVTDCQNMVKELFTQN